LASLPSPNVDVLLVKEVIIANPFLGLSYPAVLKIPLKEIAPSYGVAIGLAKKGVE